MLIALGACSSQTSHVVVRTCSINDSCHVPNEISNGFWEIFHLPLPYKLNILPQVSSTFV